MPRVIALVLLLFLSIAYPSANGRNNPRVNFKEFYTANFKVVYQDGLDSIAKRAATVAEAALPGICENLFVEYRALPKINIVISDIDDYSNGFSSPFGNKIELFASPMQSLTTGSIAWIDRLVVHELAHQITYQNLRRTFGIYSTIYYLSFIPAWFIEGIAQYEAEEWDNNRDFLLRTSSVGNALLRRERTHGFTGLNVIESRLLYEQGHSIYRFLAKTYGSNIGGRILNGLSVFSPTISSGLRRTIRMDEKRLFERWRGYVEAEYKREYGAAPRNNRNYQSIPLIAERFDHLYSFKRIAGGAVFTGIEKLDRYEENLFVYRNGSGLQNIDGPLVNSLFDISKDGQIILYSKMVRDKEGALRYRIKASDLDGNMIDIPYINGESPVFVGTNSIAYLSNRGGRTFLFKLTLPYREPKLLPLPPSVISAYSLKVSNERFYLSAILDDGKRAIVSIDTLGSNYRVDVSDETADSRLPSISSNGQLAYITNKNGPFELRLNDAESERTVVSDPLGVFAPEFYGDDSLTYIAVQPTKTGFRTTAYTVSVNANVNPISWDSLLEWKKGRVFNARTVTGFTQMSAPQKYNSLLSLKPLLIYPTGVDNTALGTAVFFSDPVGRHELTGALLLNGNLTPGWNATYTAKWLNPTISMDAAQYGYYSEIYNTGDSTLFNAEFTRRSRLKLTLLKEFNGVEDPARFDHGFFISSIAGEDQTVDTLIYLNERRGIALQRGTEDLVSVGAGYYAKWKQPFTYSDFYPLDSWLFSVSTFNANKNFFGIRTYNQLQLNVNGTTELFDNYQVLAANMLLISNYGYSNVSFKKSLALLPRGVVNYSDNGFRQLLSCNFEYRLPLSWDLGANVLGAYFEALSIAAFFDLFTEVPGSSFDYWQFNKPLWTGGALFRQRVLIFGKTITHLNGMVFYDPARPTQKWDYGFTFFGTANF